MRIEDQSTREMKAVTIYTDGGARGNPGPGGFGAVVTFGKFRKELCGAFEHTTNNRMELMAAISALEILTEPCSVALYSDSKYLVDATLKGWLAGWKKKGWVKSDRKPVLNKDLWQRLDAATEAHKITWKWVKGHSGNAMNERCDELVHEAIDSGQLAIDEGYPEKKNSPGSDLF